MPVISELGCLTSKRTIDTSSQKNIDSCIRQIQMDTLGEGESEGERIGAIRIVGCHEAIATLKNMKIRYERALLTFIYVGSATGSISFKPSRL